MIAAFIFGIVMGCVSTALGLICLVRGRSGLPRTLIIAGLWMIAIGFWLMALEGFFRHIRGYGAADATLVLGTIFAFAGVPTLLTGLATDWLQNRASRHGQDTGQS